MKILLVQLRRIGDIILTTPVLPYLKKVFPEATLDFICEPMGVDVLKQNPYVNEVLVYDKKHPVKEIKRVRSRHYDVVIDFLNNPRTALLVGLSGAPVRVAYRKKIRSLFYNVRVISPREILYASEHKIRLVQEWLRAEHKPVPKFESVRPKIYFSQDDLQFAQNWLKSEEVDPKRLVILAPVHRHPIRQWRLEGYREVGLKLIKEGYSVYLSYAPGEESSIELVRQGAVASLKLLPQTSLRRVASLYQQARIVVSNDSGAMHLAVAAGTSTLAIYGPTSPAHLTPPGEPGHRARFQALTASGVSCLGCELSSCPLGHLCMTQLTDESVFQACLNYLRSSAT